MPRVQHDVTSGQWARKGSRAVTQHQGVAQFASPVKRLKAVQRPPHTQVQLQRAGLGLQVQVQTSRQGPAAPRPRPDNAELQPSALFSQLERYAGRHREFQLLPLPRSRRTPARGRHGSRQQRRTGRQQPQRVTAGPEQAAVGQAHPAEVAAHGHHLGTYAGAGVQHRSAGIVLPGSPHRVDPIALVRVHDLGSAGRIQRLQRRRSAGRRRLPEHPQRGRPALAAALAGQAQQIGPLLEGNPLDKQTVGPCRQRPPVQLQAGSRQHAAFQQHVGMRHAVPVVRIGHENRGLGVVQGQTGCRAAGRSRDLSGGNRENSQRQQPSSQQQ